MALDNYANFVRGSLTAAVDNSQTTFPVNNASIFPDPASGNYNLVVWDVGSHPRPDQDPDVEVVRVTGRDTGTDELTVTRGQEATAGVSHPDGSALHLSYTAKLAADIETDYVAEGENFDGQGTSEFTNLAAVNTEDSVTVTTGEATDTLHYGSNQDRANAGDQSVAVGIGARVPTNNSVSVGYQAAQNNTGDNVTAAGYLAAQNNTGTNVTAAGYRGAQNNTGNFVTAAGHQAAENNTGDFVTAAGYRVARGDGLGDPTTMGDDNIGIGLSAIRNNQASGLIAIGQDAGINAQTDDQLIITQRDGTRRMVMDLTTGDLSITGTVNESATL